jgi:cytoskeletal protein CcmA (bactofilin family)
MKNDNKETENRSLWQKVKDGFSSFFFEPIPTTGGTDMPQKTNPEPAKKTPAPQTPQNETRDIFRKKDAPAPISPIQPAASAAPEKAYIPKDTVIEGNIVTSSDMQILGIVNGNVTSEGQISLSGKIVGNVEAGSLTVNSGTISGDIACTAGVTLTNQAIINGKIDAQSVDCNGEIRGDVKTSKTVILRPSALVCGDIITKTINMQDGAILQGNVKMPADKTSAQIYFEQGAVENM